MQHPFPSGAESPIIVAIADADVPVRLSGKHYFVREAAVLGHKALRTDNDAAVYIGKTSGNGEQPIPISEGGTYILVNTDLYDWFVDGTAGDGLVIQPIS